MIYLCLIQDGGTRRVNPGGGGGLLEIIRYLFFYIPEHHPNYMTLFFSECKLAGLQGQIIYKPWKWIFKFLQIPIRMTKGSSQNCMDIVSKNPDYNTQYIWY